MSAFLAALIEKLIVWLTGLVTAALARWNAMRVVKNAIEKKNQQILEITQNAKTTEERENAAKEVLRDL